MNNKSGMRRRTIASVTAALLMVLLTGAASMLFGARSPATSVTIANNSNREIRHLYLSPTNQDAWGDDLLDPSTIVAGGTFTLNSVDCTGADIKVVAEDQDGCFLYQVVACGESTTWTMTNDSARDCGN